MKSFIAAPLEALYELFTLFISYSQRSFVRPVCVEDSKKEKRY